MIFMTRNWNDIRFGFEVVDTAGEGRTGLEFKGAIQRNSDDMWLAAGGWQEAYAEQDMVEPDDTNLPGWYELALDEADCNASERSYRAKMEGDVEVIAQPGTFIHVIVYFSITVAAPPNQRTSPR